MRKLALLLAIFTVFACEEKKLTDDNPAPAPENVRLATSFLYDEERFYADSVITNEEGLNFFITDVQLVVSQFYYREAEDTLAAYTEPFVVSLDQPYQSLIVLPKGGYSGRYGLRLGLDSLQSLEIESSDYSSDHELNQANVFRNDGKGIDHVVIKGRLIDPTDPEDSTGSIDLEYRLGTYITSKSQESVQKNFSVIRTSNVEFLMQIDLAPIFNEFDLEARPKVITDPSNLIDYAVAQEMADSLQVRLY